MERDEYSLLRKEMKKSEDLFLKLTELREKRTNHMWRGQTGLDKSTTHWNMETPPIGDVRLVNSVW
jgi:ribosomal protein L32E